MKYLVLTGTVLAVLLSACGGDNSSPSVPATRLAALTAAVPSALNPTLASALIRRPMPDDDPGSPPPRTSHRLHLVLEGSQAKVCQRKGAVLVCATVEAPPPAGTTVQHWQLADGSSALTYTRNPGVQGIPDPDGVAAVRFQAAFNGAARAVLAYPGSSARASADQNSMVCDHEDCVEDSSDPDPVVEVSGSGGSGGGGGGGIGGWDGGGGGGGGGDGSAGGSKVPVVTVVSTPDPIGSIPTIMVSGRFDADVPLLPPRDPLYDLAALDNTCTVSPIITVCVHGKRPPLPPSERLPSGRMPWLPQWACELAAFLCSNGQVQHKATDPLPDETPGEDRGKFQRCLVKVKVKLDFCAAMKDLWDFDRFVGCLDEVQDMMDTCAQNYGPPQ